VKFALLFAAVLWVSKAAQSYAGSTGIYLAAVLAGTTDVDAITLSSADLTKTNGLDPRVATTAIFLASLTNTAAKGILASVLGGWKLGRQTSLAMGATIAGGVVAYLLL
jgi:uncharacterized membrane protein (DUF4010 family)